MLMKGIDIAISAEYEVNTDPATSPCTLRVHRPRTIIIWEFVQAYAPILAKPKGLCNSRTRLFVVVNQHGGQVDLILQVRRGVLSDAERCSGRDQITWRKCGL